MKLIEFSKDVTIKLQHSADLQKADNIEDMVVLRATPTPGAGSNSSRQEITFEEIEGTEVEFSQNGHFGVIKLRNLFSSTYKIGRKKGEGGSSGMSGKDELCH